MRIWILLIAVTMGLVACNSEAPTEEVTLPEPPNNEVSAPSSLTGVFNSNTGVLRGIDFSMDKTAVSGAESADQVESNDNSMMYSVDINDSEFVDLIYTFSGDQLSQIEMDVYASDVAAADTYYQDLVSYFNNKYLPRESLWDGAVNDVPFTTFVQKVEDPENPGVIVFYERMSEASAAVYGE
ncbi:MAG: hypothetical protein GYB31_17295 [Bacteroidetes bacterium]|nr:hypothetical protein [Bacteroidota bacterium]